MNDEILGRLQAMIATLLATSDACCKLNNDIFEIDKKTNRYDALMDLLGEVTDQLWWASNDLKIKIGQIRE